MKLNYLVPADTARALHANLSQCRNLRLILSRYLSKETVYNHKVEDNPKVKWRDKWLGDILKGFHRDDPTLQALVKSETVRWEAMTAHACHAKFSNPTRFVIGLGGKGALEFGITLHHVTGLPYIPGSVLKGLTRSYALLTLAEAQGVANDSNKLKEFDKGLANPDTPHEEGSLAWHYQRAFGSQGAAGSCQFFDGVLTDFKSEYLFSLEVMTPHFFSYYSDNGKSAPHDGDNPNPVSFLTVSKGNTFAFAIGGRGVDKKDPTVKQAFRWMADALSNMGVGGKTSSGLGYFSLCSPNAR